MRAILGKEGQDRKRALGLRGKGLGVPHPSAQMRLRLLPCDLGEVTLNHVPYSRGAQELKEEAAWETKQCLWVLTLLSHLPESSTAGGRSNER